MSTVIFFASISLRSWLALREGIFMFWETLWALVLGFGISGAVQAFASRGDMVRLLGDHRPKSILRASGLGMISSSCSYAATAMAKSLFERGADFLTAMAFMFASTNLVVELGVVLAVLMGWQFTVAEFVGGPIMIALFVVVGAVFLLRRDTDKARVELAKVDLHTHADSPNSAPAWKTKDGWSSAAKYTMADLNMLRRELLFGYLIAGVLAVAVPMRAWGDLFITGHGALTTFENVIVGPIIACISFVCSIGNVPMAAALWHGGISFGGVVSFIFADLISFPLLLIYRKYYGTRIAVRLGLVFWGVMAVTGAVVEGIFNLAHGIPKRPMGLPVKTSFAWNYTTFLNFVAVAAFLVLLWLARRKQVGEARFATDPVCGMQVEKDNAAASLEFDGQWFYFCSDHCRDQFIKLLAVASH